MEALRAKKMRLGWLVGGGLAVLTVLEFIVAISMAEPLAPLAIIAVLKAWLILQYFMHISQLWSEEEGGH